MSTVPVSICIPTYNRPEGLEVALRSVLAAPPQILQDLHVAVSDNSEDDRSRAVFERVTAEHPGPSTYHQNVPGVGMIGNHNRCLELAQGRYVQILHDDDWFLPGGTEALVTTARERDDPTLVFGVHVVTATGHKYQDRSHARLEHLAPPEALRRLLTNSSYIRFPAMVVRADVWDDLGGFKEGLGGADDLEAWVRIAAVHGLTLVPSTTAAYVVHGDADTESMFNAETLGHLERVFDQARALGVLTDDEVERCQADFLHQFVLGGTWRALKAGQRNVARERLDLLRHADVRKHGTSMRWLPTALAMRALTLGARPGG